MDGSLTTSNSSLNGSGGGRLDGIGEVVFTALIGTLPTHTASAFRYYTQKTTFTSAAKAAISGGCKFGDQMSDRITVNVAAFVEFLDSPTTSHELGGNMEVTDQGTLKFNTVNIVNMGWMTPAAFELRTLYNHGYGATVIVDASDDLNLYGIIYKQRDGTTVLSDFADLSLGDNNDYGDGGTTYDKNVDVLDGTVKMYTNSSLGTANGDMRLENVTFDMYTPGFWSEGGGGFDGYVTLTAGSAPGFDRHAVTFTGTSQISFKDYSPPGATYVLDQAAVLNVYGNLKILVETAVNVRLQDSIDTNHCDCQLGSLTTLHISGSPPWESEPFFWDVISCRTGTLTGQFGGISTPPDGWWWVGGGPFYQPNALTISWEHEG